ncbi:aldehyde dehydrogenase family protein [Halomonas sp. LN1S58]|uniref:Aldehyde dehydrogenase family protein n=1 Tax=Halomonas kalidii TaxID=3043293 RepID=A0ABT6VMT8_9GAMM|nr:aldehyde dehydrogenase family protein [Halomonas kalidii]MDI5935306.1 aldehyde dehydrogenase family protein [Halomonas kalidii]
MNHERLLNDGQWCEGEAGQASLNDRYRGTLAAVIEQASTRQVDAAVEAALKAFRGTPIPAYQRYAILDRAARLMDERREQILHDLITETGYAVGDARSELDRCVLTLQQCAEEAKRIHGECVPMEGAPGHEHRIGFTVRVPRGVVCAITPFNAPLNTVAHKIAPALAAGNAVVLKPAEQTPMCANHLARLLCDAGLPAGYLNVVHGPGEMVGKRLQENQAVDFYAFTGSTAVGERIRARIGLRHTLLELGNISSTIVCQDASLEVALPRLSPVPFARQARYAPRYRSFSSSVASTPRW